MQPTFGLYADKIARDFGFSQHYTIIPFKGIYLKYTKKDKPIRTNIYPVPNLKNPFLGVHYTITVDGKAQGATAASGSSQRIKATLTPRNSPAEAAKDTSLVPALRSSPRVSGDRP